MTDEEINKAIAEACGWTDVKETEQCHVDFDARSVCEWVEWGGTKDGEYRRIPDYCNDLNAMHEAEAAKFNPASTPFVACMDYTDALAELTTTHMATYHATARQRAEAFLRTLDLWKE